METMFGRKRGIVVAALGSRRVTVAVVLAVMTLLSGCGADLQNVTSGQIGCAPSDITISDESSGWNSGSWVATCNGKRYYCSGTGSSRYGGADISRKEAQGS